MNAKSTSTEMMRHLLFKTKLLGVVRRLRGGTLRKGEGATTEERFAQIYREGLWQADGSVPQSGPGSTPEVAGRFASRLPAMLSELGARSLVDVGCGDFVWMRDIDLPVDYIGVDVVPDVVARNQAEFGGTGRRFLHLDAICQPLPAADVALCREVLFHLSFADGRGVVRGVVRSGARWLMATTDRLTGYNADIDTGDFRFLNLMRSPYGFPDPDHVIPDDGLTPQRVVGVWRTERLPDWAQP